MDRYYNDPTLHAHSKGLLLLKEYFPFDISHHILSVRIFHCVTVPIIYHYVQILTGKYFARPIFERKSPISKRLHI